MQSEKTSKTSRKVAKEKTLAAGAVEAVQVEPVKAKRVRKASGSVSSAPKKASVSPKHHHLSNAEKLTITPAPSAPSAPNQQAVSDRQEVSREAIARLAYSYWVERGRAHGHADEDWLRAEEELSIAG